MGFMSAKTAGEKWGITQRRVAVLCSEGRIPGAAIIGSSWVIPEDAKKPEDSRSSHVSRQNEPKVRPFLKWAGGKGQLLTEIAKYYPFDGKNITRYAEPFVGGGAVLFDILAKYELEAVYISDINAELINTYRAVRDNVSELIGRLQKMQAVCAMRLHALVFSAAAGVPFIATSYDIKVNGFMEYIGCGGACCALRDLTADWLCNAIDNVMSQDSRRSGEAISHRLVELERENVCAARQLLGQGNS